MGHGMVILAADNNFMGAMEEYFELSLRTENLCTSLREFVKKCRDDQIIIDRALVIKEAQILLSEEDCKEITGELRIVRGELICVEEFESVQKRHAKMQSQLGIVQRNVDKKIKSCNIAVTVVERLSLQDLYEGDGGLESQSVLVEEMKLGTLMSCKDVETMRVLIDRLHAEIGQTAKSIQFGERHGDSCALLLSMQDLRNKKPEFLKHLEDFERQTYDCNANISKARALLLWKLSACLIQ